MSQVFCSRKPERLSENVVSFALIADVFGLIVGGIYWLAIERPNYTMSIVFGVVSCLALLGWLLSSQIVGAKSKARIVVEGSMVYEYDEKGRIVIQEPLASVCQISALENPQYRDNVYYVSFASGAVLHFEDQFPGSKELMRTIRLYYSGDFLELGWDDSRTKALSLKAKRRY